MTRNPLSDISRVVDAFGTTSYSVTITPDTDEPIAVRVPSGVVVVADSIHMNANCYRLAETEAKSYESSFTVKGTGYRRVDGSDKWHTRPVRFSGATINQLPRRVVESFAAEAEHQGIVGLHEHLVRTRRSTHAAYLDVDQRVPGTA